MSEQNQVDNLINWLQNYDYNILRNEAEVETKFVHPLFQHLGYPEGSRFDKQPIRTYGAPKVGRPQEADQTYYSETDTTKHDEDSCLIIVEAKKIHYKEIDENVLKQAKSYGDALKSILLVLTNGKELKVLTREPLKKEDLVLHIKKIEDLRQPEEAKRLYDLLNFRTVKQIKSDSLNKLKYNQQVKLDQALNKYPEIQALLDEGDFPSMPPVRKGNQLTVSSPKVKIICELPLVLDKGSCIIKFSDIKRKGLDIALTHEDILRNFLLGLGTDPKWSARFFIKSVEDELYRVELGQVITTVIRGLRKLQKDGESGIL